MNVFHDPVLTIGAQVYNTEAAGRDTLPTAYGATLSWGQPSGLDHPDAATLDVDVSVPAGPLPEIGERVTLEATVGDFPTWATGLFDGVVTGLRRATRTFHLPDGSTFTAEVLRVSAVDWLGVLARRTLADEPWPAEGWGARAQRIAALLPDVPWSDPPPSNPVPMVGPRDVDNFSALAALQRTLAAGGYRLACGYGGLYWRTPLLWPDRIVVDAGQATVERSPFPIPIPARVVVEADRVKEPESVVNRVSVEYRPEDDADVSYTNAPSILDHGEMAWTLTTDALDVNSEIDRQARDVLRVAGEPAWRFDGPVQVLLDPDLWLPTANVANLDTVVAANVRNGTLIELRDVGDPEFEVMRAIGGTLTLGSESLTLHLEPPALAAPPSTAFEQAFGEAIKFDELGALTFTDAARTSWIERA